MKRTFCALGLVLIGAMAYSQTLAGFRGNISSTWLINKNISDAGDEIDYKGSYAGGFGISGIHMFNEKSGVELGLGTYTIKQQIQDNSTSESDYVGEMKLSLIDIPILFKSVSETGFYFEVGPKISLLSSNQDRVVAPQQRDIPTTDKNLSSTIFSGVLGFGWFFDINEQFKLGTGIRLNYGINDLTTESELVIDNSEEAYLYFPEEEFENQINFFANEIEAPEFNDDGSIREDAFIKYNPTNAASVDLNIGLFYVFD